ncbi:cytochrome P450 [Microcoleus sp. FACHB-831]|uniref:cytochrome P450 n=1 Tax=Microcoleus sp. FACHB-831 TaxID=2692827 RepID=UPI00168813A9|nr:cytochrome P450 [Microcoleus sp. FACHB-831]MBD1924557.1 cytochrome P450 [Microcoleus sp. FACHB-831]
MKLPDGPQTPRVLRLIQWITRPTELLDTSQKRYGDCFTVWGSNKVPMVYLGHPEAIQKVFTTPPNYLEDNGGGRVMQVLLGDNSVILLEGDRHQRQRQLLTPPFHGERLRGYGKVICEITEEVMKQWKIGEPLLVRQSMQEISLQVILRLVFGLEEGQRFEQLKQVLASLLDGFNSPFTSSMLFFGSLQKDLGAWSPWGRFIRLKQQIDELIYDEIRQRRKQFDPSRTDIFTLLMAARDEAGEPMTDVELRDELITLLMAGHETTASALSWALYWIDHHPEVREKLLNELDTTDPTAIARLPYLNAVCQETLRIYPIAIVAFPRILRKPLQVMDYEFEPGAVLFPCIYMAHQREEVYPEPKRFKPERFLERQYSPYEYLPFGGGNRRCIGMAFAQYEMKLALATIISKYRLTKSDRRPVKPVRRGLTISPPANMQMVPTMEHHNIPAKL